MITWPQRAVSYRAKCITEIPQSKSPKQICLVLGEIWGVGVNTEALPVADAARCLLRSGRNIRA